MRVSRLARRRAGQPSAEATVEQGAPWSNEAGIREVRHVSWRPRQRAHPSRPPREDVASGTALTIALLGLLALAVGMGYVSYKAQRAYVLEHKASELAATVEALGLDAGAVIFAALAFAAALSGRAAARARAGNLACVAGSLGMNLMSATWGHVGSMAVWAMPAALYAFASDTLIGEVRLRALQARGQVDAGSAFASLGRGLVGLSFWGLRLVFDVGGTMRGFRTWVLITAPVAPGHVAAAASTRLGPVHDDDPRPPSDTGGDTAAGRKASETRTTGRVRPARSSTKRALLLAAYEGLGDQADARVGRRECVAQLARELSPQVGVNEGTARRYLHEHLAARAA